MELPLLFVGMVGFMAKPAPDATVCGAGEDCGAGVGEVSIVIGLLTGLGEESESGLGEEIEILF